MKRLSEYIKESHNINEGKNGVIEGLQVGETIYILCLSKSNKPISAKIINIESNKRGNAFSIELDKEVFGAKFIDYTITRGGAIGMRDANIKNADPDLYPVYNGTLDSEKTCLCIVFGRSKEEVRDMVKSSYADKLEEMQKTADSLYNEYEAQMKKIQELTNKIYIDMSDDNDKSNKE